MRTSIKTLETLVGWLNKETGSPEAPWSRVKDRNKANIGNYHLSQCYGGVSRHRMVSEGGGVQDVFECGHVPKRELEVRLRAYLQGLEDSKGTK